MHLCLFEFHSVPLVAHELHNSSKELIMQSGSLFYYPVYCDILLKTWSHGHILILF